MTGIGRCLIGAFSVVFLAGCQKASDEVELSRSEKPLLLDPDFAGDGAKPADDYTLFEADPVRPVATLTKSSLVAVTNTTNDTLELLVPKRGRGGERLQVCGSVKVGMRPVAAAVVSESKQKATLWVTNHLSDSVSVVELDVPSCKGEVARTL